MKRFSLAIDSAQEVVTIDWLLAADLSELIALASAKRDRLFKKNISYSKKAFIPLTKLCRDVCHYCTFAQAPRSVQSAYLTAEEVLEIAKKAEVAGCTEALFTLGDKPELRYDVAREALKSLGHPSTISYLRAMCELVLQETSLLPHVNAGVMSRDDLASLREVSASQGLMLETTSTRLQARGAVHFGSPDKDPTLRLQNLQWAGELSIPFTTGILIGIGETRAERLDALFKIEELSRQYGHIQEVIVQNFRAKPKTKSHAMVEPNLEDLLWTVSAARLILGDGVNLQAPPNLSPHDYQRLVAAGLNDWGGVSPVTIDHVNPEAPWPVITQLRERTEGAGKTLVGRLPVYPQYALAAQTWLAPDLAVKVRRLMDSEGYCREDQWVTGRKALPPNIRGASKHIASQLTMQLIERARRGQRLAEEDIVHLFSARAADFEAICAQANELRREVSGETVRYVVNRNINYTNICSFRCTFCAFSKGKTHEALRGAPYDLDLSEIVRRAQEAWSRGATEVCLQGGIHPSYTGETYLKICRAIRSAVPDIHIHAFSPLEIFQGAATLKIEVKDFLAELKIAGLGSLPGTAAEILDDTIRKVICPDKLNTQQWLSVVRAAHEVGLRTTSTIMFGHVEQPIHWARHLLALRDLQAETRGITEFVPLPFVHMEAPMYLRGFARKGPTFRETILMHAVSRLVLNPLITNIQTSWVKLGAAGAKVCLESGANDMGGTLMNESISRAAGTEHGQEFEPAAIERLILSCNRVPQQRNCLYEPIAETRRLQSLEAKPLVPMHFTPPKKHRSLAT